MSDSLISNFKIFFKALTVFFAMIWILQVFNINPPLLLFHLQANILSSSTEVFFYGSSSKNTELLLLLDKPELTLQNSVYQKKGQKQSYIKRSLLSSKFPDE